MTVYDMEKEDKKMVEQVMRINEKSRLLSSKGRTAIIDVSKGLDDIEAKIDKRLQEAI